MDGSFAVPILARPVGKHGAGASKPASYYLKDRQPAYHFARNNRNNIRIDG
jgi:hypothetical protein